MCFSILDDLFDLQYNLQDDLGGQSPKSKMILELLVEQFVTYTLFHGREHVFNERHGEKTGFNKV